jgi:ribosomal protein S12 methylthiotransferase accessory factor
MDMLVTFAGGKKVNAEFAGHLIETDQAKEEGGDNSAPSPLMYCLASMGTCAGIYVLGYLQSRELPTEGVRLIQSHVVDEKSHRITGVNLTIELPATIDEKHHAPIARAAKLCTVKKLFENPPAFQIDTRTT